MESPSRTAVSWIVRAFFYTPKAAADAAVAALRQGGNQPIFAGDDLFTVGRALSFAFDERFMAAFKALNPDTVEHALIWRKYVLYWAARQALERPGDFVEAGVYRGSSARLVCNAVRFQSLKRTYWLYDAFEEVDADLRMPDHAPTLEAKVRQRFADCPNVRIIAARVPAAFAQGEPEQVALLHIDMNHVEAEIATLERFYDRLAPGAVVILDDYGHAPHFDQRIAHDRFAAARGKMILELPTGQGLLIR